MLDIIRALFSPLAAVFLLLWGSLWIPRPKTDDDLDLDNEPEDTSTSSQISLDNLSRSEVKRYLRLVAMRVGLILMGILGIAYNLLFALGSPNDQAALAVFFVIYSGALLLLQRSERSRQLLVLFIIGFVGILIWRYAIYRDLRPEHNWGLLAGSAVNLVFYLLIGRHHPPQDNIRVITE